MKNAKVTNKNLRNALLTLTLTSVLQSCLLSSSSDKPYASNTNQATTCEARTTASNMSADVDNMQNNDDLFQDVNEQEVTNFSASTLQDADTLQSRTVRIDVAQLKQRILERRSNNFHLPLLNNKSVNVVLQEVKKYSDNNIVATGRTDNDQLSNVTIVINNDVMVANVGEQATEEHYEIRFAGNGIHTVKSVTDTDTECLTEEGGGSNTANFVQPLNTQQDTEATAMDAVPQIDVLVAYTPNALKNAGGSDAIKALIQMGVADSNKAYQNSGANLSLRLVGTLALTQAEASFSSDLSALKGTSDGKWDAVHAERKRVGADLVAVAAYYANSSTAGIGYVGSTYSSGFSITKTTAFKQFSFTHELGHNIGLNHSDGYENSSGRFRTVMAYGTYTRIPRFSNPALDYNGFATGTSSNNSAKILNANGAKVAGFSTSVTQSENPTTSDPVTTPAEPCSDGETPPIASE
ncbi:reprolysin-like metallopeptidase [Pseudobdellovibrio sp. HCB154]|uniref:reprolysin-like metallopeptidase n=1 Tax=Pseudobdellovibrio sp. HCB154 TaxID=3386277 RepID=UPI0039174FEF